MKKLKIILLTASMLLAITFTFSCSGDDGGNNGSNAGESSSSDGGGLSSSVGGGNQSSSSAGANGSSSSGGGSSSSGGDVEPSSSSEDGGSSSSGGDVEPSSSSEGGESSSSEGDAGPSSSSEDGESSSSEGGVEPSSSSEGGESSSSEGDVEPSSSSVVHSSSSLQSERGGCIINSTCIEVQSEELCNMIEGIYISFCPVEVSSSSALPSSSSVAPSSSSVAPFCTANDNNSTHYCFEGTMMKEYGFLTDIRDDRTYKTVKIGAQTWMAGNLNYNATNSKCYDNNNANCITYGRLYDWATAMGLASSCNTSTCSSQIQSKHKGVCPAGWHLPSQAEWEVMTAFIDGASTEGKNLKAISGWNSSSNGVSGNGTDTYGFSALPGGGDGSDDWFNDVGNYGNWWSAHEVGSSGNDAYRRLMRYNYETAGWGSIGKTFRFSVRCLQD